MSTDRVEIYTQPPQQDQRSDSIEESITTKLEELIEKHPILPEEGEEEDQQERAKEDIEKSYYTTHPSETRHKESLDSEPETVSEHDEDEYADAETAEQQGDVELDQDGMEVPQGKIPLDGQFSTDELKKLVEVAQEKGILSEDVDLKVIDSGEIGDRIRLADAKAKEDNERKKDGESEGDKESMNGTQEQEVEKKDSI